MNRDLVLNHEPTDFGIAQTLVENGVNDDIKYKPGLGWLTWHSTKSQWVSDNFRTHLGKLGSRFRQVQGSWGTKIANKLEGKSSLDSIMSIMQDMEEFTAEWDKDYYLVGIGKWQVDVRTLKVELQKPSSYISENIANEFKPESKCPQFDKFLEQIQPNPEVRRYLQKLIGSGMLPISPDQLFHFWKGDGANGKSLLQRVVQSVLGNMAGSVSTSLFIKTNDDSANRFALARVHNKRVIFAGEVPSGRNLEEFRIKQLTGEDSVIVEEKNQAHQEVRFFATFIMVCNEIPLMKENSPAMKRRIRVVLFNKSFVDKQDRHLYDKLMGERDGILAWMLEGAHLYLKEGLGYPESIEQDTEEAIKESFVHTEAIEGMLEWDGRGKEVDFDGIRDRVIGEGKKMGISVKVDKSSLGQAIKIVMKDRYDVREGTGKRRYYFGWVYKTDEVRTEVPEVFNDADIKFE